MKWILALFSSTARRELAEQRARSNRLIFRFFDGQRFVTRDPVAVQTLLDTHPTWRPDVDSRAAELGDREAYARTIDAIKSAFGVQSYDPDSETGMTELELLNLLGAFSEFVEELKKNTLPYVTLDTPSDSTSSESGPPTTPPFVDSGSTSNAQSIVGVG